MSRTRPLVSWHSWHFRVARLPFLGVCCGLAGDRHLARAPAMVTTRQGNSSQMKKPIERGSETVEAGQSCGTHPRARPIAKNFQLPVSCFNLAQHLTIIITYKYTKPVFPFIRFCFAFYKPPFLRVAWILQFASDSLPVDPSLRFLPSMRHASIRGLLVRRRFGMPISKASTNTC